MFRELKAGRIKLEDQFKVSEHAWRTGGAPSGGSAMFAPLNSMVSVYDLIQGAAVQSGNDACIILAEGISGSEDAFVKEMNKYAKEIGLTKSHFVNSTGLPADGHVMTARELALLANYLIKNVSRVLSLFRREGVQLTASGSSPTAIRSIFEQDLGVDGLKTGFIEDAGYGLVASALRDNQRVILVVSGSSPRRSARKSRASCSNGASRASSRSGCSIRARR